MQLLPLTGQDQETILQSLWTPRQTFTWGLEDAKHEKLIDTLMPLLSKGQLCVFAGAEGSGKTSWSIEMALRNSYAGKSTAYLSLEVDPERLIRRYIERRIGLTRHQVQDGINIQEDKERLYNESKVAFNYFVQSGLQLFPFPILDTWNVEHIATLCHESKIDILFIDNLAEIGTQEFIKDEYSRYDYVVRSLLDVCRKTGTAIVLLHHLAKAKMGEPLTANSVKGNNIIITKADVVIAIDKRKILDPGWKCSSKHIDGSYVKRRDLKAFVAAGYEAGAEIEVRQVEVFKDRDWDERGVKGYLRMDSNTGTIYLQQYDELQSFLMGKTKAAYTAALDEYDLIPE